MALEKNYLFTLEDIVDSTVIAECPGKDELLFVSKCAYPREPDVTLARANCAEFVYEDREPTKCRAKRDGGICDVWAKRVQLKVDNALHTETAELRLEH
jgi:hypothetical protein